MWQVTNWDKKFNDVDDYKQNKILKYKHISAEQLKKLKIENGNIKLLSTGKFDGYSKENLCKDYINEDEVITIP